MLVAVVTGNLIGVDMYGARRKIFRATALSAVALVVLCAAAMPADAQEWHPIGPSKDTKDWLQLKSGEWLRGNMDLFRDLKMEFDSDELDDLVIDWDDIAAFRFPREMTFVFEGQRIYAGSASMRDGTIRINTEDGPVDLPRSNLLSIIEGKPSEWNFWSINANLGYTQRTGNTEQTDLVTRLYLKREATRSRLSIGLNATYSEAGSEEIVDNHNGTVSLDMFISHKFYITALSYEYYSDKFQNIDYRNTIGAGVGYFVFRNSTVEWSFGIGGGYQVTTYLSVEEGASGDSKTGSIVPSMDLDWDITNNIELDMEYSSRLGVPDIDNSTHHASADLSFDIYRDIFEVTFSFIWDRVDNPKAFEDGTRPEKNDLKLVFGFGLEI